jgi:hypothetical protein
MAGLFPAIHALAAGRKTWPRGTADRFTTVVCASLTAFLHMTGIETSGISASNA